MSVYSVQPHPSLEGVSPPLRIQDHRDEFARGIIESVDRPLLLQ